MEYKEVHIGQWKDAVPEDKLKEIEPFIGQWKTSLLQNAPNRIWIRGYPVEDLVGKYSFTDMIYLVFIGELPGEKESKIVNACLSVSVGCPQPPSSPIAVAPRVIMAGNPNILSAMTTLTLTFGEYIGNATSGTGFILDEAKKRSEEEGLSIDELAKQIVSDYRSKGKRVPGLGHPLHREMDPRAKGLHRYAEEIGAIGWGTSLYDAIHKEFMQQTGKHIAVNVDAYVGALLWDVGFPSPSLAPLLMMTMFPGVIFQCIEQMSEKGGLAGIPRLLWEFTGTPPREVPD